MRHAHLLAIAVAGGLFGTGCSLIYQPMQLTASREVSSVKSRAAWSQTVHSDLRSPFTGRYVLDTSVELIAWKSTKVELQLDMSSLYPDRVDTRGYYVWLHSGDKETRVTTHDVADMTDAPIHYTYPCKQKKKTTLTFDDGSKVDIETEVDAICEGDEHYYTRRNIISFEGDDILDRESGTMWLELRDLTGKVDYRWTF